MIEVVVSDETLDPLAALEHCSAEGHGAGALFVGRVRDLNEGRKVGAVSYDLHPALCRQVFAAICGEAREQWGDTMHLYLAHRRGRLAVGEASVIAAASSPHRDPSFRACRFLIEQMKIRAPIWKQEHYLDGDSEWIRGHALRQAD